MRSLGAAGDDILALVRSAIESGAEAAAAGASLRRRYRDRKNDESKPMVVKFDGAPAVEAGDYYSFARSSQAVPALTSSMRKRTPWLSDGLSQSILSKMRAASSNRFIRQRHSP